MRSIEQLLAPFALAPGTRVLVAVSGGVDSMVLLTLLAQADLTLTVACFDHGLRPESQAEVALVQRYAASLGVPVVTGHWAAGRHPTTGLEAAARTARYAFLTQVAAGADAGILMTAHHADDQAETVLFRLARSGASAAVAGIAPASERFGLRLLRPLLTVSKAELTQYATQHAVPYAVDASNADPHFTRNRLRAGVMPALKAENSAFLAHVARFTQEQRGLLALAEPQLAALAAQALAGDAADWRALAVQPEAVQALVLQRVVAAWGGHLAWPTQQQVLSALAAAAGTRRFKLGDHQWLQVTGHRLRRVRPAPPPLEAVSLRFNQWHRLPGLALALCHGAPAGVDAVVPVTGLPLTLRHRQPGDRVRLANGHHQLLRRLLINRKVPVETRGSLWVIAAGQSVLWCQGIDPRQLFHPADTDILQPVIACRLTGEGVKHE